MPLNPLDNPYTNREVPADQSLAGVSYVSARMTSEPGRSYDKLVIAEPALCGHTNRICPTCAHLWAADYEMFWQRTAGGRRLKAAIDAAGGH